jgi:hypothetical protein
MIHIVMHFATIAAQILSPDVQRCGRRNLQQRWSARTVIARHGEPGDLQLRHCRKSEKLYTASVTYSLMKPSVTVQIRR